MEKKKIDSAYIKNILINMTRTYRSLVKLFIAGEENQDYIKEYKKQLKMCDKAEKIIITIRHDDILASMYNTFMANKESIFMLLVIQTCLKVNKWDKTKKGYEEFVKLEKDAQEKYKAEVEQKKKQQEIFEKAKKEGKKIEYLFKDGKVVPVIMEDKKD